MVPQHYDPPEDRRRPRAVAVPAGQVIDYAPVEHEITGARILDTLRRYRGALLVAALAGALAAVLLALAQRPVYEAKALLEIQPVNDRFMNLSEMDPTAASGPVAEPYLDTQIKILQSESLLERTVDKLQLSGERAKRFAGGWRFQQPGASRAQMIVWARKHLTVRAAGQSHAVEIAFESGSPYLAADFVNTLTQEFVNTTVERRARLIQATAQLFSQQLDELKSNLDKSVAELQDFTRKTGILVTGDGSTNIEQARLTEMLSALGRAHEDRVLQQSKFERLNAATGNDLPDTVDDEVLRNYEVRLADLERQKADLTATLTPKHYKVRQVEAQIAETRAGIDRRRKEIQSRIHDQYQAAQRREDMLQTEYRREAAVVPGESSKAVEYRVLNGQVQTNRRLYEEMLVKLREATAASAMRSSNIQVIDAAAAPSGPAKPSLPLYAAAGLLGGLFLGLARILAKPAEQMAIQDPQQLASNVHLRVLGAIPDTGIESGLLKRITGNGSASPELISWKRNESVVTESFRNAFASVLLSDQLEALHTIALTSALTGEGKTTVAVNLAVLFARSNRRVLLIDGDLRRPRLNQIFGIDNQRGFSTVLTALARHETFEAADFPVETQIPSLYVIPAGPESNNVSHLLYSRATQRILWRLREDFDTILIDTPPVSVSDARGLARLADGVVLVIRAHRTPSQTAMAAAQQLSEDGARVLGTVLNYWNPKKSGSTNGSYVYGYGYYPSA